MKRWSFRDEKGQKVHPNFATNIAMIISLPYFLCPQFMAHQMKNPCVFSVFHCVKKEGHLMRHPGVPPEQKNGAPRDELKNGRGRVWAVPYPPFRKHCARAKKIEELFQKDAKF